MIYALTIDETTFQPARIANIGTLLNVILPITMAGAAMVFLTMALFGAFRYLTGGGNPEALKKAQSTIVFAVIGLLIVVFSFVGVKLIGNLLGINNFLP